MSTTNNSTSLIWEILPSLQQDLNALIEERDELLEDYDLLSEYQQNLTNDPEYHHLRSKVINAAGKMLREKNAEILRRKKIVDDCKTIVRMSLRASSRT
jgi:vacuolar-type H+-ATPase subunit E/Vma4